MKTALKILIPLAVLVVGVGAMALMILNKPKVKPEPREAPVPMVRVVRVEPQSHQFKVHTQGSVLPRTDIKLVSEVPGKVTAVSRSFAAGGFFNEGEVIVQLDQRDYELALTRAKAALAEAQVRVQREQAEAEVAKEEWKSLGKGQANPLLLREPQLAEAYAAIEFAKANVSAAELDLERTKIKAPFDGRVWTKNVDVGQYLARGEAVARIYAVDYAEIRLPIALDELAYLNLPHTSANGLAGMNGPTVILRARFGNKTHEWTGRVVRTEGEIDPRTRMLNVVARVVDPYGRETKAGEQPLAVGLFVDAEISGTSAEEVFIVPRAAIRGRDEIKLVDQENRLRLRRVEITRIEKENVIITDGLKPGELACISPLDTPVDGMLVRVSENQATQK
ncbi:MAG: efflux RND transporter periplasmic adaptor subunit [Verrucomicrobia bacterium]|jgi:RND family efflux transporter MFP subunit|nr:efflux RND transporter periplasmic adaptor subunit [Verrucomicrobiota bacterium]